MDNSDYKSAYQRQKLARERAENLLESRSSELYETNNALKKSYEKLKNQKAQLLHQEKLASIGQLSAGIAHEINNPSGFIKSNLTSLQRYTTDIFELISHYKKLSDSLSSVDISDDITVALEKISDLEEELDIDYLLEDTPNLINESIEGADRITKIVNGLKNFSRIDSDEKERTDVNGCIETTVKLVQNEIKFKADLVKDLGELPQTMAYPGGLSQVILNILVNASHAIDGFGEISIKTRHEGDWINIYVKDNGSGMKQETLNKMFDPFYTTKDVGVGTGLGLSISAGIIKQHDGIIDVESELGKGTCFTISIPVIDIIK